MNKLDPRVKLTHSEVTQGFQAYEVTIFANQGNGPNVIGCFGSMSKDEIVSITKHVCCIPDFAKALELWNKIQDHNSFEVDEVAIMQTQLSEQMEMINTKLNGE